MPEAPSAKTGDDIPSRLAPHSLFSLFLREPEEDQVSGASPLLLLPLGVSFDPFAPLLRDLGTLVLLLGL